MTIHAIELLKFTFFHRRTNGTVSASAGVAFNILVLSIGAYTDGLFKKKIESMTNISSWYRYTAPLPFLMYYLSNWGKRDYFIGWFMFTFTLFSHRGWKSSVLFGAVEDVHCETLLIKELYTVQKLTSCFYFLFLFLGFGLS